MDLEEHEPEEIIANLSIRYAPADAFPNVIGARNYSNLTPDLPRSLSSNRDYVVRSSSRPPSVASSVVTNNLAGLESSLEGLDVILFLGSVRMGRNASRVGFFTQNLLEARGHRVTVIDPLENNLAVVLQPIHFYQNPMEAPAALRAIDSRIRQADAFIVIGCEYNSSLGPALCALLDHFPPAAYAFRPSGIVVYSAGQFGGIRAAMQLRQKLSDLMTVHVPSMVVIPKVQENLSENGIPTADGGDVVEHGKTMIDQLEWYATALKSHRKHAGIPNM